MSVRDGWLDLYGCGRLCRGDFQRMRCGAGSLSPVAREPRWAKARFRLERHWMSGHGRTRTSTDGHGHAPRSRASVGGRLVGHGGGTSGSLLRVRPSWLRRLLPCCGKQASRWQGASKLAALQDRAIVFWKYGYTWLCAAVLECPGWLARLARAAVPGYAQRECRGKDVGMSLIVPGCRSDGSAYEGAPPKRLTQCPRRERKGRND